MRLRTSIVWSMLIAACSCTFQATGLRAADDEGKKDAEKVEKEKAEEETPPSYEIAEDAGVEELQKFIEDLKAFRPKARQAYIKHLTAMRPAMGEAQEKIVELLEEAGETDTERYFAAKRELLSGSLSSMMSSPEAAEKGMQGVLEYLAAVGDNVSTDDGRLAMMAGYYVSNVKGLDKEISNKFYSEAAEMLRAAGEDAAKDADMLEGIARRSNLIGKEFVLSGSRMNGDKFDIKDLRGKVVLVDFWATWCGPCVAEHPNIKANYDKFKDMGFEVVGLSVDRDREALEKFVEKHDTSWITLHDEEGKNDATSYYGVVGIPSMFLLDKEGKVVSTNARGEKLGEELVALLGEPETTEEDAEAGEEAKAEAELEKAGS